jgi:hypothetical protein
MSPTSIRFKSNPRKKPAWSRQQVYQESTRRHIPEDRAIHTGRSENLNPTQFCNISKFEKKNHIEIRLWNKTKSIECILGSSGLWPPVVCTWLPLSRSITLPPYFSLGGELFYVLSVPILYSVACCYDQWRRNSKGSDRGLIAIQSRNLPGRIRKSTSNLRIARFPAKIRTDHLPYTALSLCQSAQIVSIFTSSPCSSG